jgi:DNA-binding NarL/FixJ family response regulator
LEACGFKNIEITAEEKDSLNMVINETKPRLILVGSGFYHAGTPYMMGRLLKLFPTLNIAAVSLHEYPDSIAVWFIWHGVRSYINLWEGYDEFHRGLGIVRDGGEYISPRVKAVIGRYPEWPDTSNKITSRLMGILVLLCNGFTAESIGEELHLSRKSVYNDMDRLYDVFDATCRDEMVAKAWAYQVVTVKDMCFYDRRKEISLPEWARIKSAMSNEQGAMSSE